MGLGRAPTSRNLLFPRRRRIGYLGVAKPGDGKKGADVRRMQPNSTRRPAAVTAALTLMEGLRTV